MLRDDQGNGISNDDKRDQVFVLMTFKAFMKNSSYYISQLIQHFMYTFISFYLLFFQVGSLLDEWYNDRWARASCRDKNDPIEVDYEDCIMSLLARIKSRADLNNLKQLHDFVEEFIKR